MTHNSNTRSPKTKHPNRKFGQFVDSLSPIFAKTFMQQVQLQCFGAYGTDSKEHYRFHNWKQQKAVIPLQFRFIINKIASKVYNDYLDTLFAREKSDDIILINLFNDPISNKMKRLTSIRVERARKKISQGDLGKELGSSGHVISKIENGDYPGIKLALAVKIANFFDVKMEEFEEFQTIINQ